jgi:hypothetical protein
MESSGLLRRVALVRTDVSEELSASFIRVTRIGELGTTLAVTSNRRMLRINSRFLQEPHGVTSQKTPFFIVIAVKTPNLTSLSDFSLLIGHILLFQWCCILYLLWTLHLERHPLSARCKAIWISVSLTVTVMCCRSTGLFSETSDVVLALHHACGVCWRDALQWPPRGTRPLPTEEHTTAGCCDCCVVRFRLLWLLE